MQSHTEKQIILIVHLCRKKDNAKSQCLLFIHLSKMILMLLLSFAVYKKINSFLNLHNFIDVIFFIFLYRSPFVAPSSIR